MYYIFELYTDIVIVLFKRRLYYLDNSEAALFDIDRTKFVYIKNGINLIT